MALCRCSCGTEKLVDIYTLGKDSLSCGHERRTRVIGDSKECSNCGRLRPLSEFHRDASTPSGYRSWCMECVSDYHAEHSDTRNARMRELYRQDPQAKIAKTRHYHLDHPEWSKRVLREWHEKNADRRYAEHLERGKDPEIARKRREATMRCEQRRRAAKAGQDAAPITEEQYSDILFTYDGRCWICGVDLDTVPMHWDHYQPLSKGGAHTPENLRPSCGDCNTRKSGVWPITDERLDAIRRAVWARREAQVPDYKDSGLIPPTPRLGPAGEDAASTAPRAAIAAETGQL